MMNRLIERTEQMEAMKAGMQRAKQLERQGQDEGSINREQVNQLTRTLVERTEELALLRALKEDLHRAVVELNEQLKQSRDEGELRAEQVQQLTQSVVERTEELVLLRALSDDLNHQLAQARDQDELP